MMAVGVGVAALVAPGRCGAVRAMPGRGDGTADLRGYLGEPGRLPVLAQQRVDGDVVGFVIVAMKRAQHALLAKAESLERPAGAQVVQVCVCAEALKLERSERELGDQRLGLAVGAGSPMAPPEPCSDDGATVTGVELG